MDWDRVSVQRPTSSRWCLALLAALMLLPSGCVRRRLNVFSNPPGALVYVDNQQIGTTPCSVDFTYYGTRKIQIVKDNYETLTVKQTFNPPWYQYPPIDFITENFWPWEIRDERVVDFQMIPMQIVPTERLLENGQQLRDSAGQGAITPFATPGVPLGTPAPVAAPTISRFPAVEEEPAGPAILPPGRVIGQ